MKKTLLIGMAFGMVLASTSAFAGPSTDRGEITPTDTSYKKNWGGTGIVGTSHDLGYELGYTDLGGLNSQGSEATKVIVEGGGAQDEQKRICIYCHHPHNAMTPTETGGYSPLWNRDMSAQTTFGAYTNGLDANVVGASASDKRHNLTTPGAELGGVSLLCMSCHDGAVAMSAYSQTSGIPGTQNGGGDPAATNDLSVYSSGFGDAADSMSNHHPMGFLWSDVVAADAEIAPANTIVNGTIRISDVLSDGKMECVTCHDVHNSSNQLNAERFLWRTNDHSNFCLTCHLK